MTASTPAPGADRATTGSGAAPAGSLGSTGPTRRRTALWVHGVVYLLVGGLLLWAAQPVAWDSPLDLGVIDVWGVTAAVTVAVTLVLGGLEGACLGAGWRAAAWLPAAVAAVAGLVVGLLFLSTPQVGGVEVRTPLTKAVSAQLVWLVFWGAQTLVALAAQSEVKEARFTTDR